MTTPTLPEGAERIAWRTIDTDRKLRMAVRYGHPTNGVWELDGFRLDSENLLRHIGSSPIAELEVRGKTTDFSTVPAGINFITWTDTQTDKRHTVTGIRHGHPDNRVWLVDGTVMGADELGFLIRNWQSITLLGVVGEPTEAEQKAAEAPKEETAHSDSVTTDYAASFENAAKQLDQFGMDARAIAILASALAQMESAKQAQIANLITLGTPESLSKAAGMLDLEGSDY